MPRAATSVTLKPLGHESDDSAAASPCGGAVSTGAPHSAASGLRGSEAPTSRDCSVHEDGAVSWVANDGSNGSALGRRASGAGVEPSQPRGRRSRVRCGGPRGWVGAEEQSAWCASGLRRIQTRLVRATEWVLVPAELASPTSCCSRVMPLDLAVRWELVQAGLDNVGIEVQGLRQARSPAVLPGAGRGSGRVRDLPRLMTSR